MKKIVIILALVIALFVPASASACGRNYHARHHHHFSQRHHIERVVVAPVNDGSYQYYHDVLGKTKAWYLINIKHMP